MVEELFFVSVVMDMLGGEVGLMVTRRVYELVVFEVDFMVTVGVDKLVAVVVFTVTEVVEKFVVVVG